MQSFLASFSVCTSVRTSNISSSVPKPPGKTTRALAMYANQYFAHEEVMETQSSGRGDVRIRRLLERQPNVEADGLAACFVSAPVGRFHDPGAAAGGDDETVPASLRVLRPLGDQGGQLTRVFIIAGPSLRLPQRAGVGGRWPFLRRSLRRWPVALPPRRRSRGPGLIQQFELTAGVRRAPGIAPIQKTRSCPDAFRRKTRQRL